MRICFYGSLSDKNEIEAAIDSLAELSFRRIHLDFYDKYESFIAALNRDKYDAAFVTANNAGGMEGVLAVRKLCPSLSVVWFSNDSDFVASSYRMKVAYFSVKPILPQDVLNALKCCENKRYASTKLEDY